MGPRAKALTRTGPAAASPGQQAEALRQAAAAAKRAGAAPEALQLLAEAERAARLRHAAAKGSKQTDAVRAAVDQAAAAVVTADAAIVTAQTALIAARQKTDAARVRHRETIAELDRVIASAASPSQVPAAFHKSFGELLSRAQLVIASLGKLQSAAADGSIPDAFRKEVSDLKAAMSSAQHVAQATSAVACTAPPIDQGADVGALLAGSKQLLRILETGKAGLAHNLPDILLESMSKLQQTVLAIEPVELPDLNDALEPTGQEIPCTDGGEDDMIDGEDFDSRAHQLLAQIQSGPPEAALGFVRDHLAFVAGKSGGKGDTRFAPR